MTAYVTIKDVEIASAGMEWHGNTDLYLTAEHLADMVAAQDDPLIRSPRVKLGHLDKWFGALAGAHDPSPDSIDGMPGFGSIVNLRLVEDGAKIIGDCIEVPDWFAESVASAYPTRSAEWVWDYETQGGRKYKAVLTDVAFGSWRPAVEDLADITREQATSALIALLQDGPEAAQAAVGSTEDLPMGQAKKPAQTYKPSASVSQDRIVSAFEKWAWGEIDDGDNIVGDPPPEPDDWYWAWCRDIRVDPDEIIACVDGETWSVPFSTDGAVTVTIGTPVQVRETYVPLVATASAVSAEARTGQTVIARNLPRPERPPKPAAATAPSPPAAERLDNEGTSMDESVRTALAAKLGLPETATEDEVNAAAISAAVASLTPAEPTEAEKAQAEKDAADAAALATAEADQAAAAEAEKAAKEQDPILAEQARQLATVTAEVAELRAAAARADEEATKARRNAKAAQLVAEGRIAPADHDHYRKLYDVDEDGVDKLCASLAAGRVPVVKPSAAASAATSDEEALYQISRARMGAPTTTKAA